MIKRILSLTILSAILLMAVGVTLAQDNIYYATNQSDPTVKALDEKVVALWNERNPDMPIFHSQFAHEDFKQAIRMFITAEPAPDVMTWFAGNRANFFIERGLIADFSDVWNEPGFGDAFGAGFQAMATNYLDGQGAYFMPGNYYWWGIYYRPSLLAEAGIESTPATWDELLGACDALNAAGITPFAIGTKFRWTWAGWFDYLNMRINGPQFHLDLMLLKESYTDERVKAVFEHWQQLFEHNCFIEDPSAYTWQEGLEFMIRGDAAMYLIGDFARSLVAELAPEVSSDLDFFQFPVINPDVPIGEDAPTDGWFMGVNGANLEQGKAFLKFLGSQEVQQMYLDDLKLLPTRTDVDLSALDEITQRGIRMVQNADLVVQFYDRDSTPEMADAGQDAFMEFADDPAGTDLDDLLERLEEDRQRIVEESTD